MSMDVRNHELDAAKADFYQSLGVALQAPMDVAHARAMLDGDLVRDLTELDEEIGYGLAREVAQLQDELNAIGDPQALLVIYSHLFLVPPRKAHLNAASYLDGGFNGGTVTELEQCYAQNGVARAEQFADLADHVTVQLEFIAYLFREAAAAGDAPILSAGQFIARYPERWILPLIEDVNRVSDREALPANPYRQLLRILEAAVLHDVEAPSGSLTPMERRTRAMARARRHHAGRAVSAEEMQIIRNRLAERGLSTAHLDPACPADPFAGWEVLVPPAPRR